MERRKFLATTALGSTGFLFPQEILAALHKTGPSFSNPDDFRNLMLELLQQWCDAMLAVQINDPENPKLHGALSCPACNKIHGRCMDAVYPFLFMAQHTGEQKYLDAGIAVFEWAENVSMPDGSWTVIPDPTSWRGITVFGAIALAEALHYHGHLLEQDRRERWYRRLGEAAEFIYQNFTMKYSNINYASTAVYALNLLGRELDRPAYLERSRVLAGEIKYFFTEPNKLIFGEGKPQDGRSPRGLRPVDLGYNVEESLNSLVMYTLLEEDKELRDLIIQSLESHLEFMLPDGGWDNSWGTRQYKWSYWGSRTCDGCQPAYGFMADVNPAFGTAAWKNTLLLKQCSGNGLLYGGLHYASHGIKPCVHHTFAHAKPLATLLNMSKRLPEVDKSAPLPRMKASGVKEYKDLSTWLIARGPWRATVTSYDWIYKPHAQQASGGALSVLYHNSLGLILTASMARYMLVEVNNQQPNPGEDYALTPRIETFRNDRWYTNLYDLEAKTSYRETAEKIHFEAEARLLNEDRESPEGLEKSFHLDYIFDNERAEIICKTPDVRKSFLPSKLVVPVVSPGDEKVTQVSPKRIEIAKKHGTVVIVSNVSMQIKKTERSRVFNMVPGVEAVPVEIPIETGIKEVRCTISVKT